MEGLSSAPAPLAASSQPHVLPLSSKCFCGPDYLLWQCHMPLPSFLQGVCSNSLYLKWYFVQMCIASRCWVPYSVSYLLSTCVGTGITGMTVRRNGGGARKIGSGRSMRRRRRLPRRRRRRVGESRNAVDPAALGPRGRRRRVGESGNAGGVAASGPRLGQMSRVSATLQGATGVMSAAARLHVFLLQLHAQGACWSYPPWFLSCWSPSRVAYCNGVKRHVA
jgi:hypothetical protein